MKPIFDMKTIVNIVVFLMVFMVFSCETTESEVSFNDTFDSNILDYLMENEEEFSIFISLLEKGNLDKTLTALNPHGNGYTLFAPDNNAIHQFINDNDQFSSLDDLMNDTEYVEDFCRYHVLSMRSLTNEFPFGAFPEPALSGDYLTVSFVITSVNGVESSEYKINNQATIGKANIKNSLNA